MNDIEDTANNFARGYYGTSVNMLNNTLESIERCAEQCEAFQGFKIFRSIGGGTGSGFGSLIVKELTERFPKKTKIELAIHPAPEVNYW